MLRSRFSYDGVFTDRWSVDMLMETPVGGMLRDVRFQTSDRFQPVIDVMTGSTLALFVEVVGVITNEVFAGFLKRGG